MRCLLMCAILAGASAAWADNLPPVPKTISVPVAAVIAPKAESAPEPAKTETAKPNAEITFVLTEKKTPLPHACARVAAMPDACAPAAQMPAVHSPVAPMPPVPTEAEKFSCALTAATEDLKSQAKTCGHVVKFVANEFLRKPIYDVQKALLDLEGRRLCRQDRCLAAEAERLAERASELSEKARQTCPCDLHAKLRLLKEESEYAKKANKLAVKRAALECKEADHQQQTERLKAKHAQLFHDCD